MRFLKFRFVLLFVFLAALVVLAAWGWVPPNESSSTCARDQNAAWVSVDWTSTPVDEGEIARLAGDATRHKLKYLYLYVSYVKPDGSFSNSYSYAARFVSQFRRFNRDTRLLAWIGIPLVNRSGMGIGGSVDLADQPTRARLKDFAANLVRNSGFDGVHLDVETVWNNDPYYLRLISDVRGALGPQAIVSVAGGHWLPDWLGWLPIIGPMRWNSAYYRQVAEQADQIVVMTYDSYLIHPALYRLWMREQVRGITSSLSGMKTPLVFGLSVSREDTAAHHPSVENIQSGLAGICAGLRSSPSANVQGIAIYASWEANATDWQAWDLWQGVTR